MPVLYLIAFLLAANGLLVELNLSQVLSAVLGGTILRYHTSVGLFTLSLGLGALLYVQIKSYIHKKNLLMVSSVIVGLIAVLGPLFIQSIDPLSHINSESFFTILCYLPIVLLGIVTGVELPLFFDIVSKSKNFDKSQRVILSFDYAGMFIASLIFPVLIFKLGVFSISYISAVVSLAVMFFVSRLPKEGVLEKNNSGFDINKEVFLFTLISLVLSFCSMSYELVLAKLFTDIISNLIIAHSITIGVYLLGLGFGAYWAESNDEKSLRGLLKTEVILVYSSLFLITAVYALFTLWKINLYRFFDKWTILVLLQMITIWVGYWSGKELPYCISLVSIKTKNGSPLILASNYFGALFAGFLVPLMLLPNLGVAGSLFLAGFLNLIVFVLLLIRHQVLSKTKYLVPLLISLSLFVKIPRVNDWVEQAFLKTYYHEFEVRSLDIKSLKNFINLIKQTDDVVRITTAYQYIDLVREQFPYEGSSIGTLTMYLNKQPQFSMDTWSLYHDSFSVGALNLSRERPKEVLILGGGDGLLAGKLIELRGIQNVTMIELDRGMVDLCRRHNEISQTNNKIFDNPKLNLIYDDAYSWLKRNQKKYDAIFIDFPYPTSFELSRLYSHEFYRMVYDDLNDNGFMVLDAPVSFVLEGEGSGKKNKSPILANSIKAAGFETLFPFGPIEPFIYASKLKSKVSFDYSQTDHLPNSSFINLSSIQPWFDRVSDYKDVENSLYHPLFLEFGL